MIARSGYRFVPVDATVVAPPVSFNDLERGCPHQCGSISGTLEVAWEAETPVCVGVDCGGGNVRPFQIDERGMLPGSSLRGMLRAVMEIATFSHLGRINDHRHFGFRNFADADNYRSRVQADEIKAGWLKYEQGSWILTVADYGGAIYPIDFSSILSHVGSPGTVTPVSWREMGVHEKRDLLSGLTPNLLQPVSFKENGQYHRQVQWGAFFTGAHGYGKRGYLVVGDKTTDPGATRANEVFVGLPSTKRKDKRILREDFMALFRRINSNPGREQPEPTGAWRYWLGQKAACAGLFTQRGDGSPGDPYDPPKPIPACRLPGIPVFFCGDPKDEKISTPYHPPDAAPAPHRGDAPKDEKISTSYDPRTSNFVMGLSRVIKIPYHEGVSDVAARIYAGSASRNANLKYRVPKLEESFDFARAIFGWVDLEVDAAGRPVDRGRAQADVGALAGRVAFSHAFTCGTPETVDPQSLVFGAPRESFWRFYLHGDYHGGGSARPVGRKRYPVRSSPMMPVIPNQNVAMRSEVRFHKEGTTYHGRIRVHNLHPVELGALIWCLGFGCIDGPWRHSIGRGKGYGYGCLKLNRVGWRRGSLRVVNLEGCVSHNLKEDARRSDFDALAALFETYMTEKLPGSGQKTFAGYEAIKKLRGFARSANGDRYVVALPGERYARLSYPEVGEFGGIRGPLGDGETWNPTP